MTAGWANFLEAAAGAASALAGLVFVALSINLARIIELPGVAGRAGETLVLLGGALIGVLVVLIPSLGARSLGALLLFVALAVWGLPLSVQLRALAQRRYHRLGFTLGRMALHQAATLPFFAAALTLPAPGALTWFAAGVVLCLAVGLINAWVLLVEILR